MTTDAFDPSDLLPLRPQDLQVLLLLNGGPLHAYGISKAAEEQEGGVRLEIGSLYRMLNRMLTTALIEEVDEAALEPGHAAPRRAYRISERGRAVLEAELARLRQVLSAAEAGLAREREA